MIRDPITSARIAVALDLVAEMQDAASDFDGAEATAVDLKVRIYGLECVKLDAAARYWQAREGLAAALAGDPHPKIKRPTPCPSASPTVARPT